MRAAPSESLRRTAARPWRRARWLQRLAAPCGRLLLLTLLASAGIPPAAAGTALAADRAPTGAAALDTSHPPAGGDWVVAMRAGDAVWRQQGEVAWQTLQPGQVVPPQSEIETGSDGALTLVVGGDRLALGADSRLILPTRQPDPDQRLHHAHGRLRFDVETRAGRSFEVRTPLLSLGIKGTSFELAVDRRQNSVLVLDGMVAVTLPGGRAPIDLGAREGWRQPVEPGAAPARLEVADLPARVDRALPVRWHLPDTEIAEASAADWSMRPVGAARAQSPSGQRDAVELRRRTGGAQAGTGREDRWFGTWLDHQTSLVTILLIAGGGLVILIIPGMVLGQNLRAQWQNRPAGKGRRRRSLIHG